MTTPTDRKSLEKYSIKAKERLDEFKSGNEEQKERDARRTVTDNCKKVEVRGLEFDVALVKRGHVL